MKKTARIALGFFLLAIVLGQAPTQAADEVSIGHPACLSGKYAKAGEQAVAGIKASYTGRYLREILATKE